MARVVLLTSAESLVGNEGLQLDLDGRRMAQSLESLREQGKKRGLHPLILDRVGRILEEDRKRAEGALPISNYKN